MKKIYLFLLTFIALLNLHAQTINEIVTKYIDFTGGEQQWKKIETIIVSGTYNYGGVEFPFTSYSKRPDLYKYFVGDKEKYFVQAFDGQKGWRIDVFNNEKEKTILTGKQAIAMLNEADVELESPFINYNRKGHKAMLEGKDTVNGKNCFKVNLIKNSGDKETYFFQDDDFELVKKQAVAKNTELDSSILDVFYSDFISVEGIMFPFKSICKANNQIILTITVNKVQLNEPISDNEFKP